MSDYRHWSGLLLSGFVASSALVASELQDPTRPTGFQSAVSESMPAPAGNDQLTLQAIFFNPERPAALINGRRFSVGDMIGDSRIEAIHADRVELLGAAGLASLVMALPQVKTRPGESMPDSGTGRGN